MYYLMYRLLQTGRTFSVINARTQKAVTLERQFHDPKYPIDESSNSSARAEAVSKHVFIFDSCSETVCPRYIAGELTITNPLQTFIYHYLIGGDYRGLNHEYVRNSLSVRQDQLGELFPYLADKNDGIVEVAQKCVHDVCTSEACPQGEKCEALRYTDCSTGLQHYSYQYQQDPDKDIEVDSEDIQMNFVLDTSSDVTLKTDVDPSESSFGMMYPPPPPPEMYNDKDGLADLCELMKSSFIVKSGKFKVDNSKVDKNINALWQLFVQHLNLATDDQKQKSNFMFQLSKIVKCNLIQLAIKSSKATKNITQDIPSRFRTRVLNYAYSHNKARTLESSLFTTNSMKNSDDLFCFVSRSKVLDEYLFLLFKEAMKPVL